MIKTQKTQKEDEINANESLSLQYNKTESKTSNRKCHLRSLFGSMFCCSCFDADGHKYMQKKSIKDVEKPLDLEKKENKRENEEVNDKAISETDKNVFSKNQNENNKISSSPITNQNEDDKIVESCLSNFESDQTVKYLPEVLDKNKNKRCCVIDLDETLVHSSYGYVKTADIQVTVDIDGIQQKVYVCKRPFVDEFIAEVGKLFECILFTASLGKYADPVTDYLDPDNSIFEARLFREACVYRDGNYVKDLSMLGRVTDQVLILDNSPVSYLQQPRNAIQIISWFEDPADTALRDLLPYLREMANSGPEVTVPQFLEENPLPDSVGVFGYPPSSLHWFLAQCHSVPVAKTMYHQQQNQQNFSDEDDEECDESAESEPEDMIIHHIVETKEQEKELDIGDKEPSGDTQNDIQSITVTVTSDKEIKHSQSIDKEKNGDGDQEKAVLKDEMSNKSSNASSIGCTHDYLRRSAGNHSHHKHQHHHHHLISRHPDLLLTQETIKDFRRKSQAALEEAFHRPPVSSPVARPRSELNLGDCYDIIIDPPNTSISKDDHSITRDD